MLTNMAMLNPMSIHKRENSLWEEAVGRCLGNLALLESQRELDVSLPSVALIPRRN